MLLYSYSKWILNHAIVDTFQIMNHSVCVCVCVCVYLCVLFIAFYTRVCLLPTVCAPACLFVERGKTTISISVYIIDILHDANIIQNVTLPINTKNFFFIQ